MIDIVKNICRRDVTAGDAKCVDKNLSASRVASALSHSVQSHLMADKVPDHATVVAFRLP